jgi:hypothetical protein
MSRLRKQPFTKPIPPGAEIVTHKGKPHARFKDDDGKTVLAPLTQKGDRIRLLSAKWYGEYRDSNDQLQTVPLSTDKTAAAQMLAALVKRAELGKAGIVDPFEKSRSRPLAEHLADYRRYLEAEGNCGEYVTKTCARINAILGGCRFTFIQDLDATKVAEFLHGLRRDPPPPTQPPGAGWF